MITQKDFEKAIKENCELHYVQEMQNDIPKAAAACYELAKQMAIDFAAYSVVGLSDTTHVHDTELTELFTHYQNTKQ